MELFGRYFLGGGSGGEEGADGPGRFREEGGDIESIFRRFGRVG